MFVKYTVSWAYTLYSNKQKQTLLTIGDIFRFRLATRNKGHFSHFKNVYYPEVSCRSSNTLFF